ncbi:MAG: PQQ-binding-like beta-propeller repeat protein, partial [Planctomycetes bacterium]|nr:PQQ-binding-like beta-propeller repeat protein [Planctomycetota bacterium]
MQAHRNPLRRLPRIPAWLIAGVMFSVLVIPLRAEAGSWPTYRADNARSGVSREPLKTPLHLQWAYTPRHAPRPAWPEPGKEMNRMAFDYAYQVAIADGLVFFGSSADHKVYAIDLKTGQERWSFFTEGPIRFSPVVSGGRVFVASDDGCVYCLAAETGKLIWKFRCGPRDERLIGNEQMISRWPARAGVLVEGDAVYVTAGMWSFDGVYVYALRAQDGSIIWKNDTCANIYMGLPHNMCEGIAGLAPQGYLVFWKGVLAVPNGRAEPGGFDAKTGRLLFCQNETEKMHHPGGSRVFATNDLFFGERRPMLVDSYVHLGEAGPAPSEGLIAYDLHTGVPRLAIVNQHRAVVARGVMYTTGNGTITAVDMSVLLKTGQEFYASGKADPNIPKVPPTYHPVCDQVDRSCGTSLQESRSRQTLYPWASSRVPPFSLEPLKKWQAPLDWTYELILAGNTLVAGGRDKVTALATEDGKVLWKAEVPGQARGLAVADGRLIVSTSTGEVLCFGPKEVARPIRVRSATKGLDVSVETAAKAERILKETNIRSGYCLMLGAGEGRLAGELARRSDLVIYCIEPDAQKAATARDTLDSAGLYGARVTVHDGQPNPLPYADYFANLIVIDAASFPDVEQCSAAEIYRVLRPFGGVVYIAAAENRAPAVAQWLRGSVPATEIRAEKDVIQVVRGALPGAGKWTHEYGDASRPASSTDQHVRLPLGMLWFGGPGPARMVSRHWRAPAPLFANGRMFIAGERHVIGVDAYNGRELWCRELPGVGRFPARQRGGNIVADDNHVYAVIGADCLQLDAGTGKTVQTYHAPSKALDVPILENPIDRVRNGRSKGKPLPNRVEWEYLAVTDEFIVGTTGLPNFSWTWWPEAYPESKYVFALRKADGKVAWIHAAENSVSPNAIAIQNKRLFMIDRV